MAASLAFASDAGAVVYTITFGGTVASGANNGQFFGGGSLIGEEFVATFEVDTSLGQAGGTNNSDFYTSFRRGGPHFGADVTNFSSPILSASLKVGGEILTLSNLTSGQIYERHDPATSSYSTDQIDLFARNAVGYVFAGAYSPSVDFIDGDVQTAPVNTQLPPPAFSPTGGAFLVSGSGTTQISFATSSLSVTLAAEGGVPEPGTWALMILGFGGTGVALRRRRMAA